MGGGRSHDRLILEFRVCKWSFVAMPPAVLKSISIILWEIMQCMGGMFQEDSISHNIEFFTRGMQKCFLSAFEIVK